MTRTEWHSRTYFAEIAEAVKCRTDDVLAAYRREDGLIVVIYTSGTDDLDTARLWRSIISADADGVLSATEPDELDDYGLLELLR